MGTGVVQVNSQLPAIFQGATEAYDEFASGVTSGFPVISYRGNVWRVKKSGDEQVYLDEDGDARQSIEVVLVKSNPMLAKIFYAGAYVEGDSTPPTCWSADGIRPDAGVTNPVSKGCEACPNNVWGSKITEQGKKTRACADVRRMAVAFRHEIEDAALDPAVEVTPLLLRVPPASLNPLKDYIEKMLKPKGIPPYALITKVGFDTDVSYPKLAFKGVQFLNDDQAAVVVALRDSDEVKHILNEAKEYSAEGTTEDGEEEASGAPQATEAGSTPSVATMQPAQQEELNSGDEGGEIAPPAPATEPDEIAAPAPPADDEAAKKKVKAAAAKKKRAEKKAAALTPVEEPAAAAATKPDKGVATGEGEETSFDDMLSGLLDG
jgi:hypothetical protein